MQSSSHFSDAGNLLSHGLVPPWLHITSDALIVLACYSIPLAIIHFVRHRKDLPYPRLFMLFGLFVVTCGTSHLLSLASHWLPLHGLDELALAATAIVAVTAALAILRAVPRALQLRSPAQLETEVAERKQAEAALRAVKEELQEAQRVAHVGSWRIDTASGHIVWSEEAYRLFDLDPELPPPEYSNHRKILTSESWRHLDAVFSRTLETGNPFELELETVRRDGSHGWMLARGGALRDASGAIATLHGVTMDITERKRVERSLRESENRFRTLVENAPLCIYETDKTGRLTAMNRMGLQLLEASSEDAVRGLFYLDAVSSTDRKPVEEAFASATAGNIRHFEFTPAHLPERTFKACFVPLTDNAGGVDRLIGMMEDITERKLAEAEIRNLAFYDALTQLPNRRLLDDRMVQVMAASKRSGRYAALMFMDLDNFKPLNDTHGHHVGDLLLVKAANRINSCVRETDTVARFGGDEFVVVLSELDSDKARSAAQAEIVAEKIRDALSRPYLLTARPEGITKTTVEHHSSTSIGVVLFIGHEAGYDDLLKWADMAMYQAKEGGRNSIRFHEPDA